MFTKLNLELQEDASQIHLLHDKLQDLLKEILLHFVKPAALVSLTSVESCTYKDESNQKDKEPVVGQDVSVLLSTHKFSSAQTTEFFPL